ncbi:MAG: LPXTG cell wall anchor domain-containing protein [Methylobacter sp.]
MWGYSTATGVSKPKTGKDEMWIVLFIVALLFVLGGALILLRSAKMPKIPDNVKAQPYEEDDF